MRSEARASGADYIGRREGAGLMAALPDVVFSSCVYFFLVYLHNFTEILIIYIKFNSLYI